MTGPPVRVSAYYSAPVDRFLRTEPAEHISVAAGRIGMATTVYTAIIEKEGELYAALCPELDVASQGATVEEATSNLREAVELFLESADAEEIKRRLRTDIFVTRIEAKHG